MDTSHPQARTGAARRPAAGLLALALAAVTAVSTVGVAAPATPAAAAAQAELSRVVVSATGTGAAGVAAAADAVVAAGGRVLDRLPLVGGVSAELPAGAVLAPGLTVAPDRPIRLTNGGSAPSTGGVGVRQLLGMDSTLDEGRGVVIAVVDTGVAAHPDLAGRVRSVNVTGREDGDGYGHGTFVAGLAAGDGTSSGGAYAGVAPAADVLDVRVADASGRTSLVTVLRGLEVAAAAGADVVNLSLSSYSPLPYQLDPLVAALEVMRQRGAVVVVPAGNDGPTSGSVTSPGVAPTLLTVGALDAVGTTRRNDDVVPDFSARGPAPQRVAKPELVAPGRSVVSLRAPGSVIDTTYSTGRVGDHYFRGSGTSFSTALVSGAAAVLQADRRRTPEQVKQLLTGTAYQAEGLSDPTAAGTGGLDVERARAAADPVVVEPAHAPVPGSHSEWQPVLRAVLAGKPGVAASSWSRLSPEAKAWAASSWSSLSPELREELVAEWTVRNWAGMTPQEWAEVDWAVRNWAVRNWAASSWSVRNWAVRNWADTQDDWLGGWDGRNWAVRNWAGRNWAASSWSGRNWAASSWSGRNWASLDEWAGEDFTGSGWAASSWSGRNWAVSGWQ